MNILIITSTINLEYRLGCTPAWWQLYKALYEIGHEISVIPYLGRPVEGLWWKVYDNPCEKESLHFNNILDSKISIINKYNKSLLASKISKTLIEHHIRPKWKKHLSKILNGNPSHFDAILFMNIPINHITGIPTFLREKYDIPVLYYDGDMPTILPGYVEKREFKFNYYPKADLTEYDAFLTNSKGVIEDLVERGAHNVDVLHYGVDPDLYAPLDVSKNIDIFYYGHGSQAREKRIQFMISEPSILLEDVDFVVGGKDFQIDLGNSRTQGVIPISQWRYFCSRSKINLNITRDSHARVYSSSTSRPFELASMGCCIVSDPYNGLEEWFKIGKEMYMVEDATEAADIYSWLLDNDEIRKKTSCLARSRILKEHTYRHRGERLIKIIKKVVSQ